MKSQVVWVNYDEISIDSELSDGSEYEIQDGSSEEDIEIENEEKAWRIEQHAPMSPLFSPKILRRMVTEDYASPSNRKKRSRDDIMFSPTPAVRIPLSNPFTPEFVRRLPLKDKSSKFGSEDPGPYSQNQSMVDNSDENQLDSSILNSPLTNSKFTQKKVNVQSNNSGYLSEDNEGNISSIDEDSIGRSLTGNNSYTYQKRTISNQYLKERTNSKLSSVNSSNVQSSQQDENSFQRDRPIYQPKYRKNGTSVSQSKRSTSESQNSSFLSERDLNVQTSSTKPSKTPESPQSSKNQKFEPNSSKEFTSPSIDRSIDMSTKIAKLKAAAMKSYALISSAK